MGLSLRIAVGCLVSESLTANKAHVQLACKALDLDTNVMIRKLDRAYFAYMPNGTYQAVYNFGKSLKELLGRFGIQEAHFGKFAEEFNNSNNPIKSLRKLFKTPLQFRLARTSSCHTGQIAVTILLKGTFEELP